MSMKEPRGEMRRNMSKTFGLMGLSSETKWRITSTFTSLEPADHEGREALAAMWVNRLESCTTEQEVQKMLDGMGL